METIRELRKKNGLSQIQLAAALEVHQTAVSQWEQGKTTPEPSVLVKLSNLFQVSVDYLLGNENHFSRSVAIPPELSELQLAFHKGGVENLSPEEIEKLVEIAKILKTEKRDGKNEHGT